MTITILVIFSLIFTTINGIVSPCENNTICQCSSKGLDDINVFYNTSIGMKLTIKVKSWEDLQIDCKDMEEWKDFNFTGELSRKILNSLTFKHCGLSNEISLKEAVIKLGIERTNMLIFQSFEKLKETLERKHLRGFSKVKKLVLSYNGLTNIASDLFWDFPKLEWLDLSNNNLVLPEGIFDTIPKLKRIDLIGNEMKKIDPKLFHNLENLEFLNLMGNALENIEIEIFSKLRSLKTLNIAINLLSELPVSIFHELKKVETIDMSFNHFLNIPSKLFDQNKELRQLLLHNNNIFMITLPDNLLSNLEKLEEVFLNNNGFTSLSENLFWGSSSLKYIQLNGNLLMTLSQDIFKGLQNLEQLFLNNNLIESLPDEIFKDLRKLKILDLSMNHIVFIPRNLFQGLISLSELNMENNQLKYIAQMTLLPLKNLTIAKFSHNQLSLTNTESEWSPFFYNHCLMELHLSNNSIQSFFSDWSISKYSLRLLNLSHNRIRTLSTNNFIFPSDNIVVDLRYNKLNTIYLKEIEDLAIQQTEKRDVIVLIDHNLLICNCYLYDLLRYSNNDMPITVYNYIEIKLGDLKCIQPDGKDEPIIKQLNSSTYKCLENEYFRIGKNCQVGCTCNVRPKDRTRILDCSYRNMSEFSIDRKKVSFVGRYPLILNLTGNFLTEIPPIEALRPINVTGLLLSNNEISHITINKLPKSLTMLELHNNNISRLDLYVLNYFNNTSFKEFTLSENPIICDCETEDFLYFVQSKRFYYKDLDNIKCIDMDSYVYEMTNEQLCPVETPLIFNEEEELNETETYIGPEI